MKFLVTRKKLIQAGGVNEMMGSCRGKACPVIVFLMCMLVLVPGVHAGATEVFIAENNSNGWEIPIEEGTIDTLPTPDLPSMAPLNQEFVEALDELYVDSSFMVNEDGFLLTGLPDCVDPPVLEEGEVPYDEMGDSLEPETIPALYSLKKIKRVTPVKNQGPCGSCWAFAAMASTESNIRKWSITKDLSEQNLKNLHGFDFTPCIPGGGNGMMAAAYYTRYTGPLLESDDPYKPYVYKSPIRAPRYHIQDVQQLYARRDSLDNRDIKKALMKYKTGIDTRMFWVDAYYKRPGTAPSKKATYYNPTTSGNGHLVTIVGWNNKFPKNYFKPYTPPKNGAFLVKNSWGKNWGNKGYFWVSYYDKNIGKWNYIFEATKPGNYKGVYSYDKLGWEKSLGYGSNTAWMANVFTAKRAKGLKISAVGFFHKPKASYTIEIWKNPSATNPRSGTYCGWTSGTTGYQGYTTVKLPAQVQMAKGQRFSVVIKITTPGYNWPIPMEVPITGYTSKAQSSTGQSYVNSDPTKYSWSDLPTLAGYQNTNVCIKAYGK